MKQQQQVRPPQQRQSNAFLCDMMRTAGSLGGGGGGGEGRAERCWLAAQRWTSWRHFLFFARAFFYALAHAGMLQGAAVSSVLYLRNVLPEGDFRDAEVARVRVRNLDVNAANTHARQLACFVEEGLLQAVADRALQGADLFLSRPHTSDASIAPSALLETYSFDISELDSSAAGGDGTKSVQMMLRKLLVTTELLDALEGDVRVSFRLRFAPHVPDDYQPRWFATGGAKLSLAHGGHEPLEFYLGNVDRAPQRFTMSMAARAERMSAPDDPAARDSSGEASPEPASVKRTRREASSSTQTQAPRPKRAARSRRRGGANK